MILTAQGGDEVAMTELCRRFAPLVKSQARLSYLRTVEEEVESEAWAAVVQAVWDYDPACGVPGEGMIAARVRFAVWNFFKRERRRWQREEHLDYDWDKEEGSEEIAGPEDTAEQALSSVLAADSRRALQRLPVTQRMMLERVYLQGMTLQQAGKVGGVSHQAVHKSCTAGIKCLRQQMGVEA